MRIEIDEERCCGGGQCVEAAPEVFDQRDEDGLVLLLDAVPPPSQHAAVRTAAHLCPTAVIRLIEDDRRPDDPRESTAPPVRPPDRP
ncbi:Ferredoxin-2 [Streptomyces sp. AVP053U2]|nr:Ferredoxin-2 [Streptomyces sp. AVP053U2]